MRFNHNLLKLVSHEFNELSRLKIFEFNRKNVKEPFLYPRLDLGYGIKGYGSNNGGAGIHTDNWGRLISILYYVNEPQKMNGGEHRMYELRNKIPFISYDAIRGLFPWYKGINLFSIH